MRGNNQNFNIRIHNPIEDVVRETGYAVLTNRRRELDSKTIWAFTYRTHCLIESQQVSFAKPNLTGLPVRHMFKVLNACGFVKEVTHLSKAFACRRTSSAGMRLDNP